MKKEQYDPYAIDRLAKIPLLVKVLLLKFWGAGATGYLVFLGMANIHFYDQILAYWLVLAVFLDIIINRIIRMWEKPLMSTSKYTVVTGNIIQSILLNFLYAFVITLIISVFVYFVFLKNRLLESNTPLPIIYGISFIILDAIVLKIKFYISKFINHHTEKRLQKPL